MSGDVFGHMSANGNSETKKFKYGRVNASKLKKEICGYPDICRIHRTTEENNMSMCMFCKWAADVDVPRWIDEEIEKKGYEK